MAKKYKGQLLKGSSHAQGGIDVAVGSRIVEMEGGEGVVNKRSMASKRRHRFNGKEKSTCQIVSELNQKEGNGVKFDCNTVEGKKYFLETGGFLSHTKNHTKIFLPYTIGSFFE